MKAPHAHPAQPIAPRRSTENDPAPGGVVGTGFVFDSIRERSACRAGAPPSSRRLCRTPAPAGVTAGRCSSFPGGPLLPEQPGTLPAAPASGGVPAIPLTPADEAASRHPSVQWSAGARARLIPDAFGGSIPPPATTRAAVAP